MGFVAALAALASVALASVLSVAASASAAPEGPPWLGVAIADGIHGVRVDEVIPDTPADEAGVLPGDEISAVAGTPVATVVELQAVVTSRRVAESIELILWREGRMMRLPVLLAPKMSPSEILYRRLVNKPAPYFDVPALWGSDSGRFEHLRGRVIVVEFFALACKECEDSYAALSRLMDERGRDGLAVLAVSREAGDALRAFSRRLVPSFTVLHDLYGEMFRAFRVEGLPAIVVINRDGEVCYAGIGGKENLEHAIFAAERALRGSRSYWAR
jgi:peroxiredoxin